MAAHRLGTILVLYDFDVKPPVPFPLLRWQDSGTFATVTIKNANHSHWHSLWHLARPVSSAGTPRRAPSAIHTRGGRLLDSTSGKGDGKRRNKGGSDGDATSRCGAGLDERLRALFSVHSEPFTLVVRQGSGIHRFDDPTGRSVNIGNPGSGQRDTMR